MSLLPVLEPHELCLLTLLFSDSDFDYCIKEQPQSIMTTFMTIEDVFARINWVFRLEGSRVTIGPGDSPLVIEDDVLYSGTLAQLEVYKQQGYDFPSRNIAGSRNLKPISEVAQLIDLDKVDAVVEELAPLFVSKYKKARTAVGQMGLPMDDNNLPVISAWNRYLKVCSKIFAYLHSLDDKMVNPKKGYGSSATVAALFGGAEFGHIRPMVGQTFSENEKFMLQLYCSANPASIIDDGGVEIMVKPFHAFSAIGAAPREFKVAKHELPAEMPEWEIPVPPVSPASEVRLEVCGVPTGEAEQLLWDFCRQDLNTQKELQRLLVAGGRTAEARDLWAGVSASRRQASLRALPREWTTFSRAAELMAAAAELPCTPAFRECVAARLLATKGTVDYDPSRRVIKRKF